MAVGTYFHNGIEERVDEIHPWVLGGPLGESLRGPGTHALRQASIDNPARLHGHIPLPKYCRPLFE